jgi:prolyl oligopeptidase
MKYNLKILLFIFITKFATISAMAQVELPAAIQHSDTVHGIVIKDPYQYFEDTSNEEVAAWMEEKNKEAVNYLRKKNWYDTLLHHINMMDEQAPIRSSLPIVNHEVVYISQTFTKDQTQHIIRMNKGLDSVNVILTNKDLHIDGITYEMFDFNPSPDNRYLAMQLYPERSDEMEIHIYDMLSSSFTGEVINESISYYPFWLPDSRSFFYTQLSNPTEEISYYDSVKVKLHSIGTPQYSDIIVLQRGSSKNLSYEEGDFPAIQVLPDGKTVACSMAYGISQYIDYYVAPLKEVIGTKAVNWKRITGDQENILSVDFSEKETFMLQSQPDSTTSILFFENGHEDVKKVLINEKEGYISDIYAARDALYYEKNFQGVSQIIRVDYKTKKLSALDLPFKGNVTLPDDPTITNTEDIFFGLESWNQGYGIYRYDYRTNHIERTNLRPAGKYDQPKDIVVEHISVYSHDSIQVPLTIIYKKGMIKNGNNPVIMEAYGAYGIPLEASLQTEFSNWLENGGIIAQAHVRGGGENGPQWHTAGRKKYKSNSWKDFTSCAQYLIDENYSNPSKMGVIGGSAGAITVGMALNEAPYLFGAAILDYPVLNPSLNTDQEQFEEFGDPNDSIEFQYLHQMDPYYNMLDLGSYPPVLIIAGKDDQRIPLYTTAKYAAKLEQYSKNPVLFMVQNAGHGTTGEEYNQETADIISFFMTALKIDI